MKGNSDSHPSKRCVTVGSWYWSTSNEQKVTKLEHSSKVKIIFDITTKQPTTENMNTVAEIFYIDICTCIFILSFSAGYPTIELFPRRPRKSQQKNNNFNRSNNNNNNNNNTNNDNYKWKRTTSKPQMETTKKPEYLSNYISTLESVTCWKKVCGSISHRALQSVRGLILGPMPVGFLRHLTTFGEIIH